MIKIDVLEKMEKELVELRKENTRLYEKQAEVLQDLMNKYQDVAKWYISKGITFDNGYYSEIGDNIFLSEDEDYIYYWNLEENNIRRINLSTDKENIYNPFAFVKLGHFENAKSKILNLEVAIFSLIEHFKLENKKLEESLKSI